MNKIIRFKSNSMKMAVIATIKEKNYDQKDELEVNSLENEFNQTKKNSYSKSYCTVEEEVKPAEKGKGRKVIFIKGSAEKVLSNCAKETYPIDAFDYIVDMAEKGFILYCYAVKELHGGIRRNFDYH